MCAEASTILRAVVADFFFNCWYLEIPSDNRIRHLPKCVHIFQLISNLMDRDSFSTFCGHNFGFSASNENAFECITAVKARST
jgi:hypothetical protein